MWTTSAECLSLTKGYKAERSREDGAVAENRLLRTGQKCEKHRTVDQWASFCRGFHKRKLQMSCMFVLANAFLGRDALCGL